MNLSVAVLLTCYNRKEKTLSCLDSLYKAQKPEDLSFDIFIVDDGCTDGTTKAVKEFDKNIHIFQGAGNLFWAGGMRIAFKEAREYKDYDFYLLLNDDVELKTEFLINLFESRDFILNKEGRGGLYSSSTLDKIKNEISYGGHVLPKGIDNPTYELLIPTDIPQKCHLTNANILLVEKEVIDEIGFFDNRYIHSFADYDFSLRAFKAGFPIYITADIGGFCQNDHGNNWSNEKSLKKRIEFLKSPTGLEYEEYLFYMKRHFPKYAFFSYVKIWLKTFFPFLLEYKYKLTKT